MYDVVPPCIDRGASAWVHVLSLGLIGLGCRVHICNNNETDVYNSSLTHTHPDAI